MNVDLNVLMREGHIHLAEAEQRFLPLLDRHVEAVGRPARIFELGCASGLLTAYMAERFPSATIVANEEFADLAVLARERLAGTRVQLYTGPFSAWSEPVDILISGGAHHHLPHDYLQHARRLLPPGGIYLMGDEFCPEYLHGEHARRIATAEVVHLAKGYILTSAAEVAAFERDGAIPRHAIEMERLRKRALWHWYRFVVDHAIEHDHIEVAVEELKSTHDDLITGSEDEHKFCPSIFERQLALAGFQVLARHVIGPAEDPSLQSFVLYECRVTAA